MPESISLTVANQIRVAGSNLSGEVELNFPLIQEEQLEEVHVKLRGSVYTLIGQIRTDLTETEEIFLVREETSVWTRGSAYPPPDSHVLRIPFSFTLPHHTPPSCDYSAIDGRAVVRYIIEAVGVRPGALRMNKRVFRSIAVLPADPAGARIRSALRLGWTGGWASVTKEKQIRASLFGGHAIVKLEFRRPEINEFPLFTPIPFVIEVVTFSKSMKHGEISAAKPIWPAPPTTPQEVRFELRRNVHVRTRHLNWQGSQKVTSLGGFNGSAGTVEVSTQDPEWVPSDTDGSRGKWKQSTSFSSTFTLTCPPTFNFPSLILDYTSHIELQFSGWQNDISLDVPFNIVSGVLPSVPGYSDYTAPPSGDPETDSSDWDHPLLPSTLDLPPSYWNAADLDRHTE